MYIAEFQKVSKKQYENDLKACLNLELVDSYESIVLPSRATKYSAGYDFVSPISIEIKPNETVKIPSGVRCKMEGEYVLNLYPRSSLGIKHNVVLANTVGIIDADYYNALNEGHIIIALTNHSNTIFKINANDKLVQGVFTKYYLALEEEVQSIRVGGIGSSGK